MTRQRLGWPAGVLGRDWAAAALLHGGVLLGLLALAWAAPTVPRLQRLALPLQWTDAPAPVAAAPQPVPAPLPPQPMPVPKPQRAQLPAPVTTPQRPSPAAVATAHSVEPAAASAMPYAAPVAERAAAAAPAATVTAAATAGPSHDPGAEHRWQAQLEAHLLRDKHYPLQARRARQEGAVTVEAHFNADGALLRCVVHASSGFSALDEAAVAMVKRAADAVRAQHQPGRNAQLRLPIVFELKES